jgi:carbonic anhydrase/acetyltransferase-like protein (isoleucine patch superfamily)
MYSMPGSIILPYKGISPTLGKDVFLAAGSVIVGRTRIGDFSNIWFNTVIRGDENEIVIGRYTNVQDNAVVHITEGKFATIIGDYVTIGHSAVIHACTIEDLTLIGMGAVVLDGARIKRHSLVAAGSVVPPGKSYPEASLIMGSPAKVVRQLSDLELDQFEQSAMHYVAMAKSYVPG